MGYLIQHGYHAIPVNPVYAGQKIFGKTVYASLADVPEPIDIVDVFRRTEFLGEAVDEALALERKPKVIWMQLGLRDDAAAQRAGSPASPSSRTAASRSSTPASVSEAHKPLGARLGLNDSTGDRACPPHWRPQSASEQRCRVVDLRLLLGHLGRHVGKERRRQVALAGVGQHAQDG